MANQRYRAVLEYWFGSNSGPDLWFGGSEAVDREIRDLFLEDLQDAIAGKLSAWEESHEGTVALVVLLDQFSLQLYRDQRVGYDWAALAVPVAERALEKDFDRKVSFAQRAFLYMPYMHAENLELQEKGVRLFSALAAECAPENRESAQNFLNFSRVHRDVVAKFGRFPGRNECYGRENSVEEQSYLNEGGHF